MLRLILLVVFLFCLFVGGLAFALNHWFGWKGMVAFPFVLLFALWLGKKLFGVAFRSFGLALMSGKSSVLRGASLQVHSIKPVATPAEPDLVDDSESDSEDEEDSETDEESEEEEEADEEESQERRECFTLEVTITPGADKAARVWEPGELMLTSEPVSSLADLEEKEVGHTQEVLVWTGSAFEPDEAGKYAGSQRLQLTIGVVPGTSRAWLQYYNQSLGEISLPVWAPPGETGALRQA